MKEKVAFIICYDEERYLEECVYYINKLHVPKELEVDIISVGEVSSLAEGYNAAMQESDARYKVYLDEHTFIINDFFLYEMVEIFQANPQVGMFGVCGSDTASEDLNRGRVLLWDADKISEMNMQGSSQTEAVGSLSGMLMATQYDLEWEGECGVTHCAQLREKGYDTIIPYQKRSWCLYDCALMQESDAWKEYRFHLGRVEMYHDLESAAGIENLLLDGSLSYEEHMKQVEGMSFTPHINGYFWEDFLLSGKKRNKYLPANGTVWLWDRQKNSMHVVMAFNHRYVCYAAVMLQSLYENNSLCDICVHILHCELTLEDKRTLEKQAKVFGNKVLFYDFDKKWLPEGIGVTDEWSIEAYFRLYMTDLLPADVDRVLYLDVDVIVNKPIYDFYFMDMQGYDIVGCRDFSRVLNEKFEDKRA